MEAKDSRRGGCGGGGGMIPGLFEEVMLAHVVTRLPWYVRPVCRAFSKSWRAWIDTSTKQQPELQLKSRKLQLPLLNGCVLVCTYDTDIFISKDFVPHEEVKSGGCSLQWNKYSYQIYKQWRKLPPFQGTLPPFPRPIILLGSSGIIYMWPNKKYVPPNINPEDSFVLKIDLGCGDWTWKKIPVPGHFNEIAVHFNGKIYVPRVLPIDQSENQEKEMLLVHDMMTDECKTVKAWNYDNLRVLGKKRSDMSLQSKEEMYAFVEHVSLAVPKLESFVYDACNDSWRTRDKIPIPKDRWSELSEVKLVNGDCFEPASDEGINTVWFDSVRQVISWFNSSLHEAWVDFVCSFFVEGKILDYIQFIHGSLFGIFLALKEDQDDEGEEEKHCQGEDSGNQQYLKLCTRTLMKGTMVASSKMVIWEEVLDIGCFSTFSCLHRLLTLL